MRLYLGTSLLCLLVVGCATDDADTEGPDFDDPAAKLDGPSQPAGMYKVIEPSGGFSEGQPRVALLDLRSDGSVYDLEYGPVQLSEDNFGEGQSEKFGTY